MKIAFTSCCKIQNQPVQPAWKSIEDEAPDHLLLLGDNVYSPSLVWSHKKLEKRYKQQFKEKNFKRLIRKVPYNAIWDDHDFGTNNIKGAHKSDKKKNKSRELFHRYMNCSTNLPHVYHSFELDDIKFIMLDVRYYREKPRRRKNATLLGREQEAWLERELDHDRRFTVVCSASCLTKGGEKIESYKDYYPRLCDMLKNRGRVLFLSGDIHKNRFVQHDGFFEGISSGVGRNGLNNYGIADFDQDQVRIKLRGSKRKNVSDWVIDAESWSLV